MLEQLLKKETDLVAVEDVPAVRAAMQALSAARAMLDQLEADEKRMIKIVTGLVDTFTDAQLDEARATLSIRKGTQSAWFCPSADAQRDAVKRLTTSLQAAVEPARARLLAAGEARMVVLTKQLYEAVKVAQKVAREIETLQKAISDGGVRPPEHPCSSLLPGQIVEFQLRIAKTRGWL